MTGAQEIAVDGRGIDTAIWRTDMGGKSPFDGRGQTYMGAVQRKMNLRIISGWRSISRDAANVLSGMPPVRLLALERSKVWHGQEEHRRLQEDLSEVEKTLIREEARDTLFSRWQDEWNASGDGRWTHALIPRVKEWMLREYGAMEYRLTQALSGHGCFGNYLVKRGHRPTSSCRLCGEEEDDVEHTLFTCPTHDDDRRRATAKIGAALSKDNLIPTMLASGEMRPDNHLHQEGNYDQRRKGERRKKKRLKRLQDG